MAVYREGYTIVEDLQKNHIKIFNDALDFGVPTKKDDRVWKQIQQLVNWYGVENSKTHMKYEGGETVTHDILLMDEWSISDERKSKKDATEIYRITYVTCNKGKCKDMNGYVTVLKISK